MNYKQNYIDFIKSRKSKNRVKNDGNIYEMHHILPKSLGGTDDDYNLVLLTLREHYIAHYLLWKFTKTIQMSRALFLMSNKNKKIISSRQYEKVRKEVIENLSKKVVCLETGEIMSLKEASVKFMCSDKGIAKAVLKKNKSAVGFHWEYFDETKDYTKNEWYGKTRLTYSLPLIRLEDCKIYKTWREAQKDNNVASGSISVAIRKKSYCNGYHWEYFDETKDYTKNEWYGKKQSLNNYFKKVVCLETGEIFESQEAAARKVGLKRSGSITRSIKDSNMTFAGYHWEYFDEAKDYTKNKWYGKEKKLGRKVVCLETGEIFFRLNDVEKKYGVKACGLVDCLNGRQKTFAGYHWEDFDETKDYTKNEWYGKVKSEARCKKIICYSTGEIFNSLKEAAYKLNKSPEALSGFIKYNLKKGKKAIIKGAEWGFYEN